MAFDRNSGSNNNNSSNKGENDSWKAEGFLNFYLPTQDGGRRKLGSIPLKGNKQSEKDLLKWLNEDKERVAVIMAKLQLEYQAAEQAAGSGFDLSDPAPAKDEDKLPG
jgi:hypothetical protein